LVTFLSSCPRNRQQANQYRLRNGGFSGQLINHPSKDALARTPACKITKVDELQPWLWTDNGQARCLLHRPLRLPLETRRPFTRGLSGHSEKRLQMRHPRIHQREKVAHRSSSLWSLHHANLPSSTGPDSSDAKIVVFCD
jgi:hypothetical protein